MPRFQRIPGQLIRLAIKTRKMLICLVGLLLIFGLLRKKASTDEEELEDEDLLLRYRPPSQSGVEEVGRRMEIERTFWKRRSMDYVDLTEDVVQDFVIVTAASFVYYPNSLEAISSVQEFFPGRQVFFYDLKHRKNEDDFIREQVNSICGVTYRFFNRSQYPPHVANLDYYSWKPLIIYEMLKEFPGVLWIDSSIRFTTKNFTGLFQEVIRNDGMLTLTSTGHSNYAVTHPQMYAFLPTSMEGMINTDQHEANSILLYRTRIAFENVIWWWVLCALDPLCIAPTDNKGCNNPYRNRSFYVDCHRFDQSALNILLANYFAYDYKRYIASYRVANVMRFPEKKQRTSPMPSWKEGDAHTQPDPPG